MTDLLERTRTWIQSDPDPTTRAELENLVQTGDVTELKARMEDALTFGTAGIRGPVGAGAGRMNRAVVIRTTYGLASYLGAGSGVVVLGFDARTDSRRFAEDAAGVLAAAGIPVLYFPEPTPTPLVAYAAKHFSARAAVVITASHNPPADNGYKVYGPEASQITPPTDGEIQEAIASAPPANEVERVLDPFSGQSDLVRPVSDEILSCYWEEVSRLRSRQRGSNLTVIYTPLHGVGGQTLLEIMARAGHTGYEVVAAQAEPDGAFPTVAFPNPEEPGALDLALDMARSRHADLVVANDPDADRLAVVVPHRGRWRPMHGNEVGVLLADYILSTDPEPSKAIVGSSVVSTPLMARMAASYGASHAVTLTGFKWIVKACMTLEEVEDGRFVFGFEEALGYTVGSVVRDKDGISAALLFTDLVADLAERGETVMDRLHDVWARYGLWVSAQVSIARTGVSGVEELVAAVERLGDDPPEAVGDLAVTAVTDYRKNAAGRPPWLGEQALIELTLGGEGRILVRPSGTEPKLKIYIDLSEPVKGDPDEQHSRLVGRAGKLGESLAASLGL